MKKMIALIIVILMLVLANTASAERWPEYPCGWQWLGLDNAEPYELATISKYRIESVAVNMTSHTCFWSTPENPDSHCFTTTWGNIGDDFIVKVEPKEDRHEACEGAYGDVEVVEWYGYLPEFGHLPIVIK